MPSTYTHYRFGNTGLKEIDFTDKQIIDYYRPIYDFGVHGPDIFFYYKPWEKNPVNQTGYKMHETPMIDFLKTAKEAYDKSRHKDAVKAYIYGFAGHFLLDSFCHTYIEEKIESDKDATHNLIETELDRYFMEKDGLSPFTDSPGFSLRPSRKKAKLIKELFPQISKEDVFSSISQFKFFVDLITPKNKFKRNFLIATLKASGNFGLLDKILADNPPECCLDSNSVLEAQFEKALEEYPKIISQVREYLENGTDPGEYFNRHFGAWYETN